MDLGASFCNTDLPRGFLRGHARFVATVAKQYCLVATIKVLSCFFVFVCVPGLRIQ